VGRGRDGALGLLAVLALAACNSPGTLSEGASPTSNATSVAPAPPSTAQAPASTPKSFDFKHFRSPSGNVGCVINSDSVRCDVGERDWSPPPKPADCRLDWGQGISVVVGEPAEFVCAGDTTLGPDADPLRYGESITVGSMRCDSAESGVTCREVGSGHGFTLAREAYTLF